MSELISLEKRWSRDAACAAEGTGIDPDKFYPGSYSAKYSRQLAQIVCKRCPVQSECLKEAIDNDEVHGIWGGKTPGERTALKRHPDTLKQELERIARDEKTAGEAYDRDSTAESSSL